ncbi:type II toxin-antitoxin system Phd/YefM family antitoxin [Brachybacterium muris]|uniref:type II toxin-antitoxin system Phd/YefM family antitoxin n=1 Tax=Brachybacterium muris TaxID=219301 RepID=UPI00223B7C2A|nr:type II toxin-antitoxin system prevent-host-death family antitoxin [Brachybacterium muris]MCT1653485.1 type II toxin-antitoxin system prevent-host-death family antitoxin [Brachybacterium muris]
MVTTVNMHEAKSSLSALVKRALDGEEITIARAGEPLVDLVPHRARRVDFGLARGAFACDPEVFDGADEVIADMFYGPA